MTDDGVSNRQPSLMRAVATLDPWFFADASDPFVSTHRRISGAAGPSIFEPPRPDVLSSPEERAKQMDFFRWGRGLIERHACRQRGEGADLFKRRSDDFLPAPVTERLAAVRIRFRVDRD